MRRRFRISIALAFSIVFASLVGCSGSSARVSTIEGLTADTTSGATLYTSNCATCHGATGSGGSVNKNIVSVATSNTSSAIDQILNGGDGMASFSNLSDQQIADIVGYVKTL